MRVKRVAVVTAIAVAALGAAFLLGRASVTEPDISIDEKVVVEEKKVEETEQVEAEKKAEVKVIVRDRWLKPDGTAYEHVEEHIASDTERVVTKTVTKVEEKEVVQIQKVEVKTPRPDWKVAALVGLDASDGLLPPAIAYGASVERRIIGPISVGVWGLVNPTAGGVSLSVEF